MSMSSIGGGNWRIWPGNPIERRGGKPRHVRAFAALAAFDYIVWRNEPQVYECEADGLISKLSVTMAADKNAIDPVVQLHNPHPPVLDDGRRLRLAVRGLPFEVVGERHVGRIRLAIATTATRSTSGPVLPLISTTRGSG